MHPLFMLMYPSAHYRHNYPEMGSTILQLGMIFAASFYNYYALIIFVKVDC
jgi:hypothetical protein